MPSQTQSCTVPNSPGVYFIRCDYTGSVYVGSAKNMRVRVLDHFARLRRGVHPVEGMLRDWREYGPEGFASGVMQECGASDVELAEAEQFWISAVGVRWVECGRGYNGSAAAKRVEGGPRGPRKRVLVPGKLRNCLP